ncbi:NDP-hexose-3-ketoreductase [Alphaproteobacteria bacterium]|nr:NDP-hexose-3-ketoreductase [Alphaproteobacteria bacterium]
MDKIRIGVLGPSEIAYRRVIPSLKKIPNLEYIGVASADIQERLGKTKPDIQKHSLEKCKNAQKDFGGEIFLGYENLLSSDKVDCVYIPLPPALHYKWAKKALEYGKHVFLEKPFTISLAETKDLIETAQSKNLALHENYMFLYHSQLEFIKNEIANNILGDLRLIQINFGFPFRGDSDFRYNKFLGGGALFDCAGYTIKLASVLLGNTARIAFSKLNFINRYDVDIYGNAVVVNDDNLTANISFGMDNDYRCSLDIWGSKGSFFTDRIFTAPNDFEPVIKIKNSSGIFEKKLSADDHFENSARFFMDCMNDIKTRQANYSDILKQAELVEQLLNMSSLIKDKETV